MVKMTAAPEKKKSKRKSKSKKSQGWGISQKEYESVFGTRKGFL
jgi:hypothetical protein